MNKSKLKKRLRKKLRVGEFQEFGFEISAKFKADFTDADFEKFVGEFIGEVEKNKLWFGGGGSLKEWKGFLTSQKNYHTTIAAQKEKIKSWLENRVEIAECEVGESKDAWYDN